MSFATDSFSFRRGLSKAVLLASTLLLSVQSHAFQSNAPFGLHEKAIERIYLASKISPVKVEGPSARISRPTMAASDSASGTCPSRITATFLCP